MSRNSPTFGLVRIICLILFQEFRALLRVIRDSLIEIEDARTWKSCWPAANCRMPASVQHGGRTTNHGGELLWFAILHAKSGGPTDIGCFATVNGCPRFPCPVARIGIRSQVQLSPWDAEIARAIVAEVPAELAASQLMYPGSSFNGRARRTMLIMSQGRGHLVGHRTQGLR